MKKLFVLSDTHRRTDQIKKLLLPMTESDYVIHLGDYVSDMDPFADLLGDKLIRVRGNGDFGSRVPEDLVLEVEGVKLFLTHGHRYRVKSTLVNLGIEAMSKDCAAALYGHTHLGDITEFDGVKMINPGSLSSSMSGVLSYCYLIIYGGKILPKIVEVDYR